VSRHDPRALHALARHRGVQRRYTTADGRRVAVSDTTLVRVLRALGVELSGPDSVAAAWRACQHAQRHQVLAPVVAERAGSHHRAPIPVGSGGDLPADSWVTLVTEDGDQARRRLGDVSGPGGIDLRQLAASLPGGQLPIGYHSLAVESPTLGASAVVVAAPARCPAPERSWGVTAPLYALRGAGDWGAGSLGDLRALAEWVGSAGAGYTGTLPLYAGFLSAETLDADPSPYRPASRLAWNEAYLDVDGLPELAMAPEAARALHDPQLRHAVEALRRRPLADLAGVLTAKRRVVQKVAEAVFHRAGTGDGRRRAYDRWAADHPETVAYAAFRARLEHQAGTARGDTPRREQLPDPGTDAAMAYHCYAQWAMDRQLADVASRHRLYLDIPVGVHPDGFDPWFEPGAFVTGASVGAPPDEFFTAGQRWDLPPLHPEGLRRQGYRHLIAVLRRAMAHAGMVRLDHVMGLHRLWVVPGSAEARHGAYVRFHADELRAVVALEAHRADTVVVGEDLGTVPGTVRRAMRRDGMLRSSIWQFDATAEQPLPVPLPGSLASLGSHDLLPFAAVLAERPELRSALGGDDWQALERCLAHLAASAAPVVLVDLADLWLEHSPQNRPGTVTAGNFGLRARRTLAELHEDSQVTAVLRVVQAARRAQIGASQP
jgi:4-alpha-glucanotransferase